MWQFLWGIFTLLVGLLIGLESGTPPVTHWPKLPTLTPTPAGLLAQRPGRLPTLAPTPWELEQRPRRLPTLTPTPLPLVDPVGQGGTAWPVEVSSVPIQPGNPSAQPAQLPVMSPEQNTAPVSHATPAIPVASTAPAPIPAGPLAALPVKGRISQAFGCSPYYTGVAGPGCPADKPWFHDALDIAAAADTPVAAGLAGTVIFAGEDKTGPRCRNTAGKEERGYGLAVVIDNGAGWRALYAHLANVKVSLGQAVTPATVIGATGQSGCVTGPHLHFGLQYNGRLVNPDEVGPGLGASLNVLR